MNEVIYEVKSGPTSYAVRTVGAVNELLRVSVATTVPDM